MTESGTKRVPLYQPQTLAWLFLVPIVALGAAVAILSFSGRGVMALAAVAAALAGVLVLFPRPAFYLFLASLSFWVPQRLSYTFALHPFDLMLAVVLLGVVLDYLLRGQPAKRPRQFDLPLLALVGATVISAVLAYQPSYSVVPTIRIIVIYLAYRVTVKLGREIGIRRILKFYLFMVLMLSLHNVYVYVMHGGGIRAFGVSALGYESLSMTALPMALAFLLWSRSLRQRLGYGMICLVIGLGIVATQARGPLLAVLIALPVLLIFSAIKARREKNTQAARSVKVILVAAALAGLVVVGLSTTLFADPWGRYQAFIDSLGQPQGTIALRLALWQTALQTFLDHPLTGIGIGNFRIVHDLYPALRISPLHLFVKGMSAHNVILHYLAETGLLGALSLLWLAGLGLRAGFRVFRMILNSRNAQVSAALFIGMFVFCLTIFYMRAWTWGQGGYVMALLFGLLAAWYEQRRVATPHSGTPAQ